MDIRRSELDRHERVVVGAALLHNELIDDFRLRPADFESPVHGKVYQSILDIVATGDQANSVTLFAKDQTITDYTGSYLNQPGTAVYAAREVKRAATKRRLLLLSAMIRESAVESEPADMLMMIWRELEAIESDKTAGMVESKEQIKTTIDAIEGWYNDRDSSPGVRSGYPGFDDRVGGFLPGEYTVIAARTSLGKTEFVVNLFVNQLRAGIVPAMFSAEMARSRIVTRMLCSLGRMPYGEVRRGRLGPDRFQKLTEAAGMIYERPFFLDDTPAISFNDLRARARVMVRRGAQIIYVDYLTLIRFGDARAPRYERIGELSKGFQRLARELNVPIIVLSQLNRMAEGKMPSLETLRQSGEIEEDADMILFLHRERDKTDTDLIVAKSRDGASGTFRFHYFPGFSRYEEAAETHG